MTIKVQHFFDKETYTLTYIVFDDISKDAIIIDPVLNYDQASSKVQTNSIDSLELFITNNNLIAHYALETHAHADHITGAIELKRRYSNIKIGIGKHITKIQGAFSKIFNLSDFSEEGIQFDVLLDENTIIEAGTINIKTIFTPGHTPACCSYLIGNLLFTGDALFMPDFGTGRCDFPMGSAKELYNSVSNKIYSLSNDIKYFTGHDYQPNGREMKFQSTIGESKACNIHLNQNTSENEFILFREKRDAELSAPKLLLPSIQVNIDGGNFPEPENNGKSYIKIPINQV